MDNSVSQNKPQQPTQSLRERILQSRYLRKNREGQVIETPAQLFRRVAQHIASAERHYGGTDDQVTALAQQFEQMMSQGLFLPNSPTLMNAGRDKGLLSACFVLPVPDHIEGIFDTVKYTALIQKAGGGTGFDFSSLRPTGDIVASSGGRTSGPLSFWRVIAETTHAIQQGAHRRGANMGMMNLSHPDILRFIHAKHDTTAFTNFNISVKVPHAFMGQLKDDPNIFHMVIKSPDRQTLLSASRSQRVFLHHR